MKTLTLTLSSIAILSLTACQTTGTAQATSEMLYSGIATEKISSEDVSPLKLSAENQTCLKFYGNTTKYAMRPKGKERAGNFGKTIVLGLLAGAASGGVASMGISSAFLETAVAGTANQIVFQGGKSALDKATGEDEKLSDQEEIELAAAKLGCPAPSKAAMKASKKAAKALGKEKKETE